jgi:hypothetical protein
MNLYRITRIGRTDYDEYAGFVIAAPDETEARLLATSEAFHDTTFMHAGLSTCQIIGITSPSFPLPASTATVVLSSFRAG